MGGKKKGRKGKRGKKVEAEVIDQFTEMKCDQLEIAVANLKEQLNDAKYYRNQLQIEKDMVHDFYQITREDIKELNARIKNFDMEMEKAEGEHRTTIMSHIQKVRHLEYEHQNNCNDTKNNAMADMTNERNTHDDNEKENMRKKQGEKEEYHQEELNNIQLIDDKKRRLEEALQDHKVSLELHKKTLIESFEKQLEALQAELELRMKVEIHEIEERKNQHINELMHSHQSAFQEMKAYYNDITRENLELIRKHKEKHAEITLQVAQNQLAVQDLQESVKKLEPVLATAKQEHDKLTGEVSSYGKNVMALRNAKGYMKELKVKIEALKENAQDLAKQVRDVESHKEDMYKNFELAISQLKSRAGYKNDQLDAKLTAQQADFERKELTLRELVQRSGLDQGTVDEICKKMEEAIEAKNSILSNLKYSLSHATKAYNDAIRVYEAKLVEFGIPAEELGLEPLPTSTSKMPAGLVAA